MKFVGRSCLFSFHASLTLHLPVALLTGWSSEILLYHFWSLSSGTLLISQNLVNKLSSSDSSTGMISSL